MCYNGACDGCSQCCDDTIYYNDDYWGEDAPEYEVSCPACDDTGLLQQCIHCYMNEFIGCDRCYKGYLECTFCMPDVIDSSDVEPFDVDIPF